MKKAIVVGGSNGIGLAIAKTFAQKGYYVLVVDKSQLDANALPQDSYQYIPCDLLDYDEDLFHNLAKDMDVEALMITAGYGRVADFEYIHEAEIQNMLYVNTVAAIRIMRSFYDRIKSQEPFYCGFMGSIAGLISSPMFSVYSASKAALCRFAESVNIELEAFGTKNRILNVSPGSIKGTRFNGGENEPSLTKELAESITEKLFSSETLYIPQYDEVYKGVMERYVADAHEYGMHSYNYKKSSGRARNENAVCIGYLSGTFDLFHVGHLNILRKAKKECDYLIVGVHPDASHKGKKTFIPLEERKAIVGSCRYVDRVVDSCPEDSDAWDKHHYNKLFVGSDYKGTERFIRYEEYFKDKNVKIVYFDYTKGTSSTQIRNTIVQNTENPKD